MKGNTTVRKGDEKEWEWQPREGKELKTREDVIEHVKAGWGVNVTGMSGAGETELLLELARVAARP